MGVDCKHHMSHNLNSFRGVVYIYIYIHGNMGLHRDYYRGY